jgi:hypothetical protein
MDEFGKLAVALTTGSNAVALGDTNAQSSARRAMAAFRMVKTTVLPAAF